MSISSLQYQKHYFLYIHTGCSGASSAPCHFVAGLASLWHSTSAAHLECDFFFTLPKFSYTTRLLNSLHWLSVAAPVRFKTLMLTYKAKIGQHNYLNALITHCIAPHSLQSLSTASLVPLSLRVQRSHASRLSVLTPSGGINSLWKFKLRPIFFLQ